MFLLVTKEDGEWKLVKSTEQQDAYVMKSSTDKGDVISLGNQLLSEVALEADEGDGMSVMVITKTSGSVQAVKTRGHGNATAEAQRSSDKPWQYSVRVKIRPLYDGSPYRSASEFTIGKFVTKTAAETNAAHLRNRL